MSNELPRGRDEQLPSGSAPVQRSKCDKRGKRVRYPQGRYWMCVIPRDKWSPWESLPDEVFYAHGQCEKGGSTGYEHWQIVVGFKRKKRLDGVKQFFGIDGMRCELTKSKAANDYCGKEETRIAGTEFTLGAVAFKRGDEKDWERIREYAISGAFELIPGDVFIRNYGNLKRIYVDNLQPIATERTVYVFIGPTRCGKSTRAWREAGLSAYTKNPRSIFWDGYRGQENVVIDEFRGGIDICHMLRWTTDFPVIVDIKGSSCPLAVKKIWITSNIHPKDWYPGLDPDTFDALMGRLQITLFTFQYPKKNESSLSEIN